jgi:hypothetical protein
MICGLLLLWYLHLGPKVCNIYIKLPRVSIQGFPGVYLGFSGTSRVWMLLKSINGDII